MLTLDQAVRQAQRLQGKIAVNGPPLGCCLPPTGEAVLTPFSGAPSRLNSREDQ
jgi:hypothetical protein